jgi:hypothetical protein
VTDEDHIETLKRAQMTMVAYATASGDNQYPDDPLTWLSDLLADLQHWAIDRELDWFDALRRAAQYVEEELEEARRVEEARHEHS